MPKGVGYPKRKKKKSKMDTLSAKLLGLVNLGPRRGSNPPGRVHPNDPGIAISGFKGTKKKRARKRK